MENLMTVVDRLDELQASSVGKRECSSTRQRTNEDQLNVPLLCHATNSEETATFKNTGNPKQILAA